MKILLIAKPWKGGLSRYLALAMREAFPQAEIEWIATRPQTIGEKIAYHRDAAAWRNRLVDRINRTPGDAALFINHQRDLAGLEARDRNILYLVDDARLSSAEAALYGRVHLSDPGYAPDLLSVLPESKFGGILPFGFYPPIHKPAPPAPRKGEVCFIGSWGVRREPMIERLFAEGFRPLIVGNSFLKKPIFRKHPFAFRPSVPNEAMGKIYARHRVSLNIHSEVIRQGTNMRTFECAGYEIPQVVEWRDGIDAYFEPEKEILYFRNTDEMADQIRRLLRDPAAAVRMAGAARKRALAEHGYDRRVKALFKDLWGAGGQ